MIVTYHSHNFLPDVRRCYWLINISHREGVYLDITECGPEALAECLKIIDSSNIVGVLGAPLDVSCDYEAYELDIDDEHCTNWLYAVAAGTKTWEVCQRFSLNGLIL